MADKEKDLLSYFGLFLVQIPSCYGSLYSVQVKGLEVIYIVRNQKV